MASTISGLTNGRNSALLLQAQLPGAKPEESRYCTVLLPAGGVTAAPEQVATGEDNFVVIDCFVDVFV
jgi:hypothetical protein